MIYKLIENLKNPEYRKAFVASQINIGLPFQLRALLKARGKTQEWLAGKTGMLQPRISALLSPGKTKPNIETLRRLAEAFDCGLAVRFVPFSELADWSEAFEPDNFRVKAFDEELPELEKWGDFAATGLRDHITTAPTFALTGAIALNGTIQKTKVPGMSSESPRVKVVEIFKAQLPLPERKQPDIAMELVGTGIGAAQSRVGTAV